MSEPFHTYRNNVAARWLDISTYCTSLYNNFTLLGNDIAANNWAGAEAHCDLLATDAVNIRNAILGSTGLRTNYALIHDLIEAHMDAGGGVDMDGILNAMLLATYEQIKQFMGITDAFLVAVWDAPFNEEFYGALARGFKTWGVDV